MEEEEGILDQERTTQESQELQKYSSSTIQADILAKKKQIRKINKRSKDKQQLVLKQYGVLNCFVREPSFEKKIFLLTDIIIDLEAFTNPKTKKIEKFEAITSWRPPVCVRQDSGMVHVRLDTSIDGLSTFQAVSAILMTLPSESAMRMSRRLLKYANLVKQRVQMKEELNQFLGLLLGEIQTSRSKPPLALTQKELNYEQNILDFLRGTKPQVISLNATDTKGNQTTTQKWEYIPQIPKETAYHTQNLSLQPFNLYKSYSLDDYFEELLKERNKLAQIFINSVRETTPYLSYMIKSLKRGNIVISDYGYSEPLLRLLGYDSQSSIRLLTQNGPLLFFETEDLLKRMEASMDARIGSMENQTLACLDVTYQQQTIITVDDFRFKCDIRMVRRNFSDHPNFFVQHCFLLQLATYIIDDSVVRQIQALRSHSKNNTISEECRMLCGVEYEVNSDIFLQKYYQNNNDNSTSRNEKKIDTIIQNDQSKENESVSSNQDNNKTNDKCERNEIAPSGDKDSTFQFESPQQGFEVNFENNGFF